MKRSHFILIGLLLTATACGSSNPTSPTPPGSPGPSGATLTISSSGIVSPAGGVDVNVGQSVTVVNNDSRNHEIASDPHPSHTDCPNLDVLTTPGQTKVSNAFQTARTCGFHDHLDPSNANLLGQVRVH